MSTARLRNLPIFALRPLRYSGAMTDDRNLHTLPPPAALDLERRLARYRARAVAEGRTAAVVQIDRAIADTKGAQERIRRP